jgi:cytoskeleton protein RodZ
MKENKNFGDALKAIREAKQFTVKEVSLKTHIHERFIHALESNKRDALPSTVQAKGYIRNLLSFYQEDPAPFLKAWESNLQIETDIAPENTISQPAQSLFDENDELISTDDIRTEIEQNYDSLSASEILNGIGKQLTIRRIQLGMELSEVEEFTHIKEHNLSFLEKGGFDQIPSPVQARGMLKIYAEFLELDQKAILKQYAEGLRKKRLEQLVVAETTQKQKNVPKLKKPSFLNSILTPDFLAVGGIVLVLFIGIIWGSSYVIRLRQEAAWEQMGIDRDIISQGDITPSATPSETPQPEESNSNPDNENPAGNEAAPPAVDNNAPVQINITARQHTWVRVTTDNQVAFEGRLVPGTPYNYNANQQIVLLTGNAASIQVLYNNQYVANLGNMGELAEVVFSNEGLITPTPLYSPTPTMTLAPSLTPTFTPVVPTSTVTPFIP